MKKGKGRKHLKPADEVEEDFCYELKALRAPVVSGWKMKLFLALLKSPVSGVLTKKMLKDSGVQEALQETVIPEAPLFDQKPFFNSVPEACATVVDPSADMATRLTTALAQILDLKDVEWNPSDRRRFTLRDYTHAYTQGICSPFDVTTRLTRLLNDWGRDNRGLSWFVSWDEDDIMNQGQGSAQRYWAGKPLSPIDGVPFSVKDLVHAPPYKTTCGTGYMGSRLPSEEVAFVTTLKSLGAIFIGKTNMHEIGIGVTGVNTIWGTPINPWGEDRYPGGSSSGAAASVGAGLCPFAMGSDGGGSIRIPCSFNGCVGLLPTAGRVPATGVPLDYTVESQGPIAGCVEDAMILYALMANKGSVGGEVPPLVLPTLDKNAGPSPLKDLKMGLYSEWFNHCADGTREGCRKAATCLENLGVALKDIRIPDLQLMSVAHTVTISSEMANSTQVAFDEHKKMNGDTEGNLLFARNFKAKDYIQSQKIRRRMSIHFKRVLGDVDFIVTPTTPVTAPKMGKKCLVPPGESNLGLTSRLMRYMPAANFLGLPAITIPVGKDSAGMPIGLQLIGKHWEEATLLRAAYHLEHKIKNDGMSCDDPTLLLNPLLSA